MKQLPTFTEEKKLWSRGFDLVIGVDEVGRGAFAGPIVAAACSFRKENGHDFLETLGINDSKQIKPQRRKLLATVIKKNACAHAIASINIGVIDKVGIAKATEMTMRRAVKRILNYELRIKNHESVDGKVRPYLLVDAFHVKYVAGIGLKNQKAIIHGDQISISIAAASIIAKVYRYNLMQKLAKKYQRYGWGRNKGYGTKKHQRAIIQHGLTRHHRQAFCKKNKGIDDSNETC